MFQYKLEHLFYAKIINKVLGNDVYHEQTEPNLNKIYRENIIFDEGW